MKKHLLAGRLMSFGRIAFLALIALSFGIMDAQATHFRYGNITWRKINNSPIRLNLPLPPHGEVIFSPQLFLI